MLILVVLMVMTVAVVGVGMVMLVALLTIWTISFQLLTAFDLCSNNVHNTIFYLPQFREEWEIT